MAPADVHTPVKSQTSNFSSRHNGRIPLTPSPRHRSVSNQDPFASDSKAEQSERGEKKPSSSSRGSLHQTLASLSIAAGESSTASPLQLGLGVNDDLPTKSSKPAKKSGERTSTKPPKISTRGDRFIPTRGATSPTAAMKADYTRESSRSSSRGSNRDHNLEDDDDEDYTQRKTPKTKAYEASIADAVGLNLGTRILAFKPAPPESSKPIDLRAQYNRPVKAGGISAQKRRRILTAPERVLDAPGLIDDYYLNLLDWGNGNQVAIGLERNVYVWNAETGDVSLLLETNPDTYVASVRWSSDSCYVSVGLSTGDVQIWDVEEQVKLRTMSGHDSRVAVQAWNKHTLTTGSRSGNIFNHDVRIAQHKTAELLHHTSEVCGLEWRPDGAQLASGANDNLVNIWDARQLNTPKFSKTNHKAAIKALSWCPWQTNLLATGGGTLDKHIHFWNTTTGARVNSIDAGSQVTALKWSTHHREIVSCHGAPDNQLTVWNYPTLVKQVEIPAHETRVLHATLSPDGTMLATAASDESLKFWKLFEKKPQVAAGTGSAQGSKGMAKQMTIR
jgi:cell division cycle protein 20 (cofactor of APC complex)